MSIKLLVADDSITIQKVIGIIFGGDEYSLTVVDNGKAAVEKAREINPDILLIDALMPGMTGYEVAEAVRATPSLADKPILILTGSFEPFDEKKAKKCGADDFIAKPFESQQIISKVKELLELGKSRVQTVSTQLSPPVTEVLQDQAPLVTPTDIWGAFSPEIEPAEKFSIPEITAPLATVIEPDVFAIVTEENDAQIIQNSIPQDTSVQHTGSQWIPVEENTFEFEEELSAVNPLPVFTQQTTPVLEASFGDITFEEVEVAPAAPVSEQLIDDFTMPTAMFDIPAVSLPIFETQAETIPAVTFHTAPATTAPELTAVSTYTGPMVLSEELLKAALSTVSKEVIERIVWEIVPDLAEAMIREAIRKIKEGI